MHVEENIEPTNMLLLLLLVQLLILPLWLGVQRRNYREILWVVTNSVGTHYLYAGCQNSVSGFQVLGVLGLLGIRGIRVSGISEC